MPFRLFGVTCFGGSGPCEFSVAVCQLAVTSPSSLFIESSLSVHPPSTTAYMHAFASCKTDITAEFSSFETKTAGELVLWLSCDCRVLGYWDECWLPRFVCKQRPATIRRHKVATSRRVVAFVHMMWHPHQSLSLHGLPPLLPLSPSARAPS